MTEKHSSLTQDLIHCLNTDYGLEITSLKLLSVGADINASVYKAEAHDRSSYFIKLKSGHKYDISLITLTLLHDSGIQPIIAPIKTKKGDPSSQFRECTLIVYPFIQGQDGFSRSLTDTQWRTLGETMRQVHTFTVPPSLLGQLKRETYSDKGRAVVRDLCAHIEVEPRDGDTTALKLWAFMKMHRVTIQRLVERAETLSQRIQARIAKKLSPELVLCHSDIHGGNVIISDRDTIHIVDWDGLIMAPKERDLMFIGGGVANVWNKPHEEEMFYKGYGKTEIDREILAYYRHERIVEDIAEYSQILLLTNDGGTERETMYQHFIAMFEPQGVVDRAFKTDEENWA